MSPQASDSDRVSDHFHRVCAQFDGIYSEERGNLITRFINRRLRSSIRLRMERTFAEMGDLAGQRLLDVGCGSGRYLLMAAALGALEAWGVDFAPGMILLGQSRAAQHPQGQRCKFILGHFLAADLPPAFDHVFAMGVMDYIEDPVPFLRRMLALSRRSVMASFPAADTLLAPQRKFRYRYFKKCPLYLYRAPQILELARAAGGQDPQVVRLARDYFLTMRPGDPR